MSKPAFVYTPIYKHIGVNDSFKAHFSSCLHPKKHASKMINRHNPLLQEAVADFCDALQDDPRLPSEWFDGFRNVMQHGQSSCDNDNSYCPQEEPAYSNYKKGAKAAESLLNCKSPELTIE